MKYIIYLSAFLFSTCVKAQLEMVIKNLDVYQVNPTSENIGDEDMGKGPYIEVTCIIKNISDSVILTSPSKAKIMLQYRYRGDLYKMKILSVALEERYRIYLDPDKEIEINFLERIFLGTDIWVDKKLNYSTETFEILPTIQVLYIDGNIKAKSCEIMDVKISEK